jgi:hypothetical protein
MMKNPLSYADILLLLLVVGGPPTGSVIMGQIEERSESQRPSGTLIPYPFSRFTYWSNLSPAAQKRAEELGYTEGTWEAPGTGVENLAFDELTSSQQVRALGFGLNKIIWDCYLNHYRAFTWEQLLQMEVAGFYSVLGHNSASWQSGEEPLGDLPFSQLSPSQKSAAAALCFTENLWNGLPLDMWESIPVSRAPTFAPTPGPTLAPTPNPIPSQKPTSTTSGAPTGSPTFQTPTGAPEEPFPPFNVATDYPSTSPSSSIGSDGDISELNEQDGAATWTTYYHLLNTIWMGAISSAYLCAIIL